MKKTMILSVPHTGTVFLRQYLTKVLELPRLHHHKSLLDVDEPVHTNVHTNTPRCICNSDDIIHYAMEHCNIIIPIRDPIENALSCFGRGHKSIDYCISNWQLLMQAYPMYKHVFWVDIWAPVENRRNMMLKLNEFLGVTPKQQLFDEHLNSWKKVNSISDEQLEEAKSRLLPQNIKQLQFAIDWHKEKKAELNKLYS